MRGNPFFILIIVFTSILVTKVTIAENNPKVIINEIMPDAAGSDSGKEWIELYNYSNSSITLSGYYFKIESNSGSSKTITIPQLTIQSKKHFVISEFDFLSGDFINIGSGKLGMYNSASKISLYNSINTKLDELLYPTPAENNTYERRGATCTDIKANNSGGSGGAENTNYDAVCFPISSEDPTSYPLPPEENPDNVEPPILIPDNHELNLQISEIYPSPDSGEEEWLEIYNASSETANLANFSLQKPSTSTKTMLSGIVPPKSYRLVSADELKFALNNSGDEIMLFSSSNIRIDSLKYKSVVKGLSVGKVFDGNKYQGSEFSSTTQLPTPMEVNVFADNTIYNISSIAELKKQVLSKTYNFEGHVTSDTDLAKYKQVYLEDETGAIKINNKDGAEYFAGNKLKVTGILSRAGSEYYIDSASFEYLDENITPKVNILNAEENIDLYYYRNVSFSGEVTGSYSTSFDVNFAGKTLRISKLPDIKISKGSAYKITGVLFPDGDINRVVALDILKLGSSSSTDSESHDDESMLDLIRIPNEDVIKEQRIMDTKIKYLEPGNVLGNSSTPDFKNSATLAITVIQLISVLILFFTLVDIKYVNLWKVKLIYWVRNIKLQSLKDFF